jgi:hypothetical protein
MKQMCWKCTNPNEACGWPPRTVRAIIAILSIMIIFGIACFGIIMLMIKDQYSTAVGIIGALLGIVGGITGYYFGIHSSTSTTSTTPDIENKNDKGKEMEVM